MRKSSLLVAVFIALGSGAPVLAQQQSFTSFVAPINLEGYPQLPADKLVPVDAIGAMQAFRGRPWWQALAFCIGVHENRANKLEREGDAAGAEGVRDIYFEQFEQPAIQRLMTDRGISEEEAIEILRPDMNFQFLVAAEEGPANRPFAADQARCRSVQANHARVG